jgi:hypothetical protein
LFLVWASQQPPPIQGEQFGSADKLLSGVRKVLDEISIDTLEAIFQKWINRLDWTDALQHCTIATNGKCME